MPKTTVKKIIHPVKSARPGRAVSREVGQFNRVKKQAEEPKAPVIEALDNLADELADEDISEAIAKKIKEDAGKPERYFEAIGRRKTAVARIRLLTRGDKGFLINGKPYQKYFVSPEDQETAIASMKKMKCLDKFKVTVKVKGGGRHSQAEAIRHGTARILVDFNQNFRKRLRKAGFLTRDPRMRERKKFGLKRARKAPQWAKR